MTREGYDNLEAELKRLKTRERPSIVKEIEIARAHGDISENAEFHAAKERQSHIETLILQVEDKLARAQVIDPTGQTLDSVRFGLTVDLLDTETDEEVSYTIVGEDETDVARGRISVTSPIARALLGKTVDDEVSVQVPKGKRQFEIQGIRIS
jgi:transcription elongation factor GreA